MLASLSLNKNELIALLPTKLNPANTALSLDGDVLTFITSMEADPKQLALELYDSGKKVQQVSAVMEAMGYKVTGKDVQGWVSGRASRRAYAKKAKEAVKPASEVIIFPDPSGTAEIPVQGAEVAKTSSDAVEIKASDPVEKAKKYISNLKSTKDRPVSPMAASEWDRRNP